MTRTRVKALLDAGASLSEIATALALSKSTVSYHARRLGIAADKRFAARYDWAAVKAFYEAGHSAQECRDRFGFGPSAWHDAVSRGLIVLRSEAEEAQRVALSSPAMSRGALKRLLIASGLKQDRCERCGLEAWRGRPLTLALHHVNGAGRDNRFENLQILCPNCHSQTPNYGGRNRRRNPRLEAAGRL